MPAPPYFPFHPRDFLDGVIALSSAERGGYISLLCHQWTARAVPGDDVAALGRIMGTRSIRDAKNIWKAIASKFDRSADGTWRNARLEKTRADVDRYFAAQKAKAVKGGRPRKENPRDTPGQTHGNATGNPQANPNETQTNSKVLSPLDRPDQIGPVETVETVENLRGIVTPIQVAATDFTEAERDREYKFHGQCPHEPPCDSYTACIEELATTIAIRHFQIRKAAS